MKNIINICLSLLLGLNALNAQNSRDQFLIQVDGLGCPFCAYGLEKKFKEFKGIKDVQIEIETGDFQFSYPEEKNLSMDAVIAQVKKAGYTPKTAKIDRANGKTETFGAKTTEGENSAEALTKRLVVQGNCEMCRARIEAAALSIEGVSQASWNKETKILEFQSSSNGASLQKVAKSIAKAGHDNEAVASKKEAYNELPLCCAYRNTNAKTH